MTLTLTTMSPMTNFNCYVTYDPNFNYCHLWLTLTAITYDPNFNYYVTYDPNFNCYVTYDPNLTTMSPMTLTNYYVTNDPNCNYYVT